MEAKKRGSPGWCAPFFCEKREKCPYFGVKRVGWINPPSKRQKAVKRDFSEK